MIADREIQADRGREQEHHLQAVISAAHAATTSTGGGCTSKASALSIPTPEAVQSSIQYDRLFPAHFAQPATYIRFSSTVEDCVGVLYCMSEEDEVALREINAKHAAAQAASAAAGKKASRSNGPGECTETWFEQLMSAFEETSAQRQPFAAVDHPPVLSLEEMLAAFEEGVEDGARYYARAVYEYWKDRRAQSGDQRLMAQLKTLKIDSGQDPDDSDPYVCFRRREQRQARKTRGRDAKVVETLKKLRRELEDGRWLLNHVKLRETSRREDLRLSQQIFEQRIKLRIAKRDSNIQDDDTELLINQKKRRTNADTPHALPRSTIRLPGPRPDTFVAPDTDRIIFADELARRERDIARQIGSSVAAHDKWNANYIEETLATVYGLMTPEDNFLPEEERENASSEFTGMKFEPVQLPTPPASIHAESASEEDATSGAQEAESVPEMKVRWAQPSELKSMQDQGRYRRRRARGGRTMLDRHNMRNREARGTDVARFAFDYDSGDEIKQNVVDLSGTEALMMRVNWATREAHQQQQQAAQRRASAASRDVPMVNGQGTAGA